MLSYAVKAQLCTGSLGDPVVFINFGSSGNSGPGYSAPGYTYINSSCPDDGFYTITSATANCFGNAWHSVNSDHTGNGNFMLVNASYTPADFFLYTVKGLCPNTTYEFSAWIMNVLLSVSGIRPDLTFKIETTTGTVLYTYNTGSISVSAQPLWQQYGFYFTTTAGVSDVVLRITNNAPGGIGNDLAIDDIGFRPCGPVINAHINGLIGSTIEVCVDQQQPYSLSADLSAGFINPVYQWQLSKDTGSSWIDIPGANSPVYLRNSTGAGNFWYRMSVAESGNNGISSCRVASNMLKVRVHELPLVNAGTDRLLIKGKKSILDGYASGDDLTLTWSPPDYLDNTAIARPSIIPMQNTYYQLQAVSSAGCANKDWVLVQVVDDIFIPTGFTPNNDGRNDYWRIPYLDPLLGTMVSVFNRYGQLVYQVKGGEVKWDGTMGGIPQGAGTYVYFLHFTDGSPDRKGTLNLIR